MPTLTMESPDRPSERDSISFSLPENLAEARERVQVLRDDIEAIELQLADPDKEKSSGKRMSSKQYLKWRRGAIKALTAKKRELRFLQRWIRDRQARVTGMRFDVDPDDPDELLALANNLLQEKKQAQGCEFSEQEYLLLDLIRDYVLGLR